jgi:predicted secreted hydrolase
VLRLLLLPVLTLSAAAPAAEFLRADKPRDFAFPRDHGAHPGFKTEWWYFTGNLLDEAGRPLGFQLTWFRSQLSPEPGPPRRSRWAAEEVFAAHAAVSDIAAGRFLHEQRTARGGRIGLARASAETFDVDVLGWTGRLDDRGRFRLSADAGAFALDLTLQPRKAPVLQGPGGVSPKGDAPGQASYYVTVPRLGVAGTVRVGGTVRTVAGEAWMDHEFGSNQLSDDQVGWDWYGLILDDGREVMVYSLRGKTGGHFRRATLVEPDGTVRHFAGDAVRLETLDTWTSPHGRRPEYPVARRIRLGDRADLTVRPRLADQEMQTGRSTGVVYYEGAAEAAGTLDGRSVTGRGYIELTGYAGEVGRL